MNKTAPKGTAAQLPVTHHRYIVGIIRTVAERRGIPTAELARRSMMSPGHLGKVMRYERTLRADEAQRVLYALGLKVNEALIPKDVLDELRRRNFRDGNGR